MPVYTYICRSKHGEFEEMHSIKTILSECPKCKEEGNPDQPVERLIGQTTFQLIGSSWAKDNYR